MLASTPEPPYYAVIFATTRDASDDGYDETAARMVELASDRPGFLGIDSARSDVGITVSYWSSEAAIAEWKTDAEHTAARDAGRDHFYTGYTLRVAKVERAYTWSR